MVHRVTGLDNIRESFGSTGTTITLGGAAENSRAFSAELASGDTFWGVARKGAEFSAGIFTYTSGSPGTIAQTDVRISSNAGAAVNFLGGIGEVYIDAPSFLFDHLNLAAVIVTCAATTNIGAADSKYIALSGTTGITSFGSTTKNKERVVTHSGETITHNATTLKLLGGINYVTASGEVSGFAQDASGNWSETWRSTGLAARLQQDVYLSGDISPAQITANQNDYNPTGLSTASVLRLNTDASRNLTGLQGGADGRIVVVQNAGSFPIVLQDQNASSSAANRFSLPGSINLEIPTGAAGLLIYDATVSRWKLLAGPSSAASTTASGIVELATDAETISGTDTARAITPSNLTAKIGAQLSGIRLAKATSFTITQAENGKTIAFTANAYDTITLPDPSTLTQPFKVKLENESTTRGKRVVVTTGVNFRLYPGSYCIAEIQNSVWKFERRVRWRPPNGTTVTFNTNFTSGTDSDAVDGFATGAGAFKTVQYALDTTDTDLDFDGMTSGQTSVVVQMAGGVTDTTGVHFAPHAMTGAQGGYAVTVQGSGGTSIIGPSAVSAFECYFGAKVRLKDLKLQTGSGHGASANFNAHLYLDNVTFGACTGGAMINCQTGGHIEQTGIIIPTGNASYLVLVQLGGRFRDMGFGMLFGSNCTFTSTVTSQTQAVAVFTGSINLNTYTVTGTRWQADYNGLLFSATGAPNTYFPGNSNGAAATQGQGL